MGEEGEEVTQQTIIRLYSNAELSAYISQQARRHFYDEADQQDARSEAWETIESCIGGLTVAQYKRIVYRVINAKYKRWRRLHKREVRMA